MTSPSKAQEMREEARKLADEIERSDGLYCMNDSFGNGLNTGGHQLGIKKSAMIVAALRSQPGTLAREEVVRAAQICRDKYCELIPGKRTWSEISEREREVDIICLQAAIFALTPSHKAPVAFRQCEQCWQPATCKKYGCRVPASHRSPSHEAGTQDEEYDPAYDNGITFAIVQLAELTGSKDWQMRDGSEDHDTDVRDTIMDVLKCAGLYDDETGKFAKTGTQDDIPMTNNNAEIIRQVEAERQARHR